MQQGTLSEHRDDCGNSDSSPWSGRIAVSLDYESLNASNYVQNLTLMIIKHNHPDACTLHPPTIGIIFGGDIVIKRRKRRIDNQYANTNCHDHAKDNLTNKQFGRKKRLVRTTNFDFVIYNQTKMM